jgi:DNA modification methylase
VHKHQIELFPTKRLRANPHNVRTHSKKQIQQIADSIKEFGFNVPIVADESNIILAGHGRWLAAKLLGLSTIPTIVLAGLSNAQRRAYLLADNKLAEKAGWDRGALAVEIETLTPLLTDVGLNIEITGFEPAEIDALMRDHADSEEDPADLPPKVLSDPISELGDVWSLGPHRLVCGDARKPTYVSKLMAGEIAGMVITDPPYNVAISSIQGRGKIKHREFVAGSGEMSPGQFTHFLITTLSLAAKASTDGAVHYIFMDWRHLREILDAGAEVYGELKNLIVWAKTNAGQGTFYRSQHELILVFKNGDGPHINNFELGQHGRTRSNVWTYAGVNTFRAGRLDDLATHPTVKPVALIADAMRDCSRRGDIVLDPFVGSGTTLMAAERVGRRGYGLELDPLYIDASIRRWQDFTKKDAVLTSSKATFEEIAMARSAKAGRRK